MRKCWDEARLDALSVAVRSAMEKHVRNVERRDLTPLEGAALGRTSMHGLLDALRCVAGEQARDGGIGRLGFVGLAEAVGWSVEWFRVLVEVLLAEGVVERVAGDARLWLVDWDRDAPAHVHVYLARHHRLFANGAEPRMSRLSEVERRDARGAFDAQRAQSARERFKAPIVRANVCAQTRSAVSPHKRNISLNDSSLDRSSVQVSLPKKRGDWGESGVCARLGSVLEPLMERRRQETALRLQRVARDGEGYGRWWESVLEQCDRADVLGDFLDAVDAVERGGIGVKSPGRFLTNRARVLLHGRGMKLPPPPRLSYGMRC